MKEVNESLSNSLIAEIIKKYLKEFLQNIDFAFSINIKLTFKIFLRF